MKNWGEQGVCLWVSMDVSVLQKNCQSKNLIWVQNSFFSTDIENKKKINKKKS